MDNTVKTVLYSVCNFCCTKKIINEIPSKRSDTNVLPSKVLKLSFELLADKYLAITANSFETEAYSAQKYRMAVLWQKINKLKHINPN